MKPIKFNFRIEHLWGLIVIIGIFIFTNTHPIRPYDFWWHIAVGRQIVSTGSIPQVDVYSYTETGQPYPSYQMFWLMETLLYTVFQAGGPALVVFLQSLLVTSAYAVILWICLLETNSWRIATLGVLFAAALGLNDWNVRPQGITFILASLILLAIYKMKTSGHWGWLVVPPICMVLWANSHGTFIIGLGLLGLWWGQELGHAFIQRLHHQTITEKTRLIIPGIVLIVSAVACLINPRGIGIIDYVRTLTGNPVIQNLVTEWAAPTFKTSMGIIFFFGLLVSAILMAFTYQKLNFFHLAVLFVFGALSLRTSRGIVWFGLLMAPIIAYHVSAIANRLGKPGIKPVAQAGNPAVNLIFASLVIIMGIISLPWFKAALPLPAAKAGLISAETPVNATQSLLAMDLPGHVFNSMSFGSYMIWRAYPQYQVFVDSRIELFSEQVWFDYLNISNAQDGWESKLTQYGVNTLMLSPIEQSPLFNAVSQSTQWRLAYQDQVASIFVRSDAR